MRLATKAEPRVERVENLGYAMVAVGLLFLAIYVATLSSGVYPGTSADWVSSALGFRPWGAATHPLWRLFAPLWVKLPGGAPAWRLNLSSALFGAVAAALLCRYVAHWVQERVRLQRAETGNAAARLAEKRKVSLVALASGVVAAVLFGTGLPAWGASTRFCPEMFDVSLVLAALLLHQSYYRMRGGWRLYALALFCGVGLVETTFFLAVFPFFGVSIVVHLYRHQRLRTGLCLGLLASGLLGLGLYVPVAQAFAHDGAVADWHESLWQMLRLQLNDARLFLPRAGWPWVLLLLVAPWVASQSGYWARLHRARDFRADVLQAACLVAVLLLQFGAPIPPWPLWLRMDRLPVLEAAVASMLGGWAFAYWSYGVLFRWEMGKLIASAAMRREKVVRQKRWISAGVCLAALALAALAAPRSGVRASGNSGRFADVCAREILDEMGGRTWLVTDGVLDTHLAALAVAEGRPLRLLNISMDLDAVQIRRLRQWVANEPRMKADRDRLLRAASLGVGAFLREWSACDPQVEDALALYCLPALWFASDLRVRPSGFLYLGARSTDQYLREPLVAEQRAIWERMRRQLPLAKEMRGPQDWMRNGLRSHLSMVANDIGVLLMDLGRDEEAFDAFEDSTGLEPGNLSALANRYLLVGKGVRPAEKYRVEREMKSVAAKLKYKPLTFDVVARYGQIQAPDALASVGVFWAQCGLYGFAKGELRRAATLAGKGQKQDDVLASLGVVSLNANDRDESERIFRSLLDKKADNVAAILGMLDLALQRENVTEARKWLAEARVARVKASSLTLNEARIEILEKRYDVARSRLLALTDREPQNLQAWTLLASALLALQRPDDVENQVLPKMEAIVGRNPDARVYLVRGHVARARGRASYGAARDAYRCALRLSPGRRDVVEYLLDLDVQMKDDAAAWHDAAGLLRIDPSNADAHFVLGNQAIMRGELDVAEAHLRASVASAASVQSLNNLAVVLLKRGSFEEAERFARQALAAEAGNASVLDTLADVLLRREKMAEALAVVGQARALAPGDWTIAFTEARILMGAGRKEEARIQLKTVQNHMDALPPHVREEVVRVAGEWRPRH